MTSKKIVLQPGILVSLRSSVSGGVSYDRTDLDADAPSNDGQATSRWETRKTVQDQAEHDRAMKVRGEAVSGIRKLCVVSSFGLICPTAREPELAAAIAAARTVADEFNATALYTRISIRALRGHIASTDEEAAAAIAEEVRDLVDSMSAGISGLDVERIREAASRAAKLEDLLVEEQAKVVSEAVKAARSAARQIVKRIQNDGESAAVVLSDIKRGAIEQARLTFLDVEDAAPIADATPAVDEGRFAAVDAEVA